MGPGGLLGPTHGAETLLELVDATLGIHKGALTSEEGVRIGREAHRNYEMFNTIDLFGLVRLGGGSGDVTVTRGHVLEDYGMVIGMDVFFHGMPLKFGVRRFRRRAGGVYPEKALAVNPIQPYSRPRHESQILRNDGSAPARWSYQH